MVEQRGQFDAEFVRRLAEREFALHKGLEPLSCLEIDERPRDLGACDGEAF